MYVETTETFSVTGYPIAGGPVIAAPAPADGAYNSEPYTGLSPSDFVPIDDSGSQAPPENFY